MLSPKPPNEDSSYHLTDFGDTLYTAGTLTGSDARSAELMR